MKHILSPRKLSFLFALAASAVALPASADSPSLRRGGESVDAETRSFPFYNEFGLGIMRFRFSFMSGDNPISRIGHMIGLGASHNWFSTDASAEYSYDVKHYPLPGVVETTHKLDCEGGQCALGIPPAPAGELLVLTGFVFEATDGAVHDVSTVAIEPDPDNGIIWVEINDGTDFGYGATVQYSYIPEEDVDGGALRSMTKTSNNHWRVQHKWPDLQGSLSPLLLHGFRVEFADGPHPLNRLHIILVTDTATIYFTDAEYDESFTGSIDVVATTY